MIEMRKNASMDSQGPRFLQISLVGNLKYIAKHGSDSLILF